MTLALGLAAGTSMLSPAQALSPDGPMAVPGVRMAQLPPEAQATHRLVLSGGPFPYSKDGVVFANRERLLPAQSRGHYREYTVKTPGAKNRGARRLVCAGKPPTAPAVCYYSDDHYASFRRIQQ